jgi:ABC-type multidrug transport system permease subunit
MLQHTAYSGLLALPYCWNLKFGRSIPSHAEGTFEHVTWLVQVFYRERLNGHYGVAAFVIGNTFSSLPFLFLISLISALICYFMVDLHPGWDHFAYFVLMLFACVACVESLMMVVASIVPNFLMGIITGAGIQVFGRSSYLNINSVCLFCRC